MVHALLFAALLVARSDAQAVQIDFGGGALTVVDNLAGDSNPATGIIDFNATVGLYKMQGTVDTGAGPNLISLISPAASLRLTNFTAEALGNSLSPMIIRFSDVLPGTYSAITAADAIDAYAAQAFGAPIPPGNDMLLDWQGYVDGWPIFPYNPGSPPYPSPFVAPFSAPVAYSVVTQGPSTFTTPFNNPVFEAILTITLGSTGDQFILQNSAEIGVAPVPEASSLALMGIGSLGVGLAEMRRRRWRSESAKPR